jgi:hypothetical protein
MQKSYVTRLSILSKHALPEIHQAISPKGNALEYDEFCYQSAVCYDFCLTHTHHFFISSHHRTSSIGLNVRYMVSYCSIDDCSCLSYRIRSDGTLFVHSALESLRLKSAQRHRWNDKTLNEDSQGRTSSLQVVLMHGYPWVGGSGAITHLWVLVLQPTSRFIFSRCTISASWAKVGDERWRRTSLFFIH